MSTYNVVAASNESTVVTEYEPQSKRSDAYQSEAALEQAFIRMLEEQGYAYLPIHDNADLVTNLRRQLEILNNYTFTDKEWDNFFKDKIANANDGIKEKTRRIQEDNIQNLTREDGSTVNITLLDKKNMQVSSNSGAIKSSLRFRPSRWRLVMSSSRTKTEYASAGTGCNSASKSDATGYGIRKCWQLTT